MVVVVAVCVVCVCACMGYEIVVSLRLRQERADAAKASFSACWFIECTLVHECFHGVS